MPSSQRTFHVALTGDFHKPDGAPLYREFGIAVLDAQPGIRRTAFAENLREIAPEQIGDAQAVIVLVAAGHGPQRFAQREPAGDRPLRRGLRFGRRARLARRPTWRLVTAVGAVDRSVAEATLGWMLALTHQVRTKDRLVREGRWNERAGYMGRELRDRTLGIVGMGGIGRALVELVARLRHEGDPGVRSVSRSGRRRAAWACGCVGARRADGAVPISSRSTAR